MPDAPPRYGRRNGERHRAADPPVVERGTINDVPAQSDFYSTANGRLLNDLLRSARDADKVALLLKVWRQRLSYRLVRSAEESKIALLPAPPASKPRCRLFRTSWPPPSPSRVWKPHWINR